MVYNSRAWKEAENPDIKAFLQYVDGHKPENSERVSDFADDIERFKDDNITSEEYMDYILMKTDLTDKGIAIGEERGAQKKALETVRNAFSMGLSAEQAATLSGLPLEQVKALKTT